jgi:hypothetical protein
MCVVIYLVACGGVGFVLSSIIILYFDLWSLSKRQGDSPGAAQGGARQRISSRRNLGRD